MTSTDSTHAPREGGQRSPSRMWERTLAGGGKLACTLAVWGVSGRVGERKELFSQFEKFAPLRPFHLSNGDETREHTLTTL